MNEKKVWPDVGHVLGLVKYYFLLLLKSKTK